MNATRHRPSLRFSFSRSGIPSDVIDTKRAEIKFTSLLQPFDSIEVRELRLRAIGINSCVVFVSSCKLLMTHDNV